MELVLIFLCGMPPLFWFSWSILAFDWRISVRDMLVAWACINLLPLLGLLCLFRAPGVNYSTFGMDGVMMYAYFPVVLFLLPLAYLSPWDFGNWFALSGMAESGAFGAIRIWLEMSIPTFIGSAIYLMIVRWLARAVFRTFVRYKE